MRSSRTRRNVQLFGLHRSGYKLLIYAYVYIPDTTTSPCTLDLWRAVDLKTPSVYTRSIYRIGTGEEEACNFCGFVHGRNYPADISLGTE